MRQPWSSRGVIAAPIIAIVILAAFILLNAIFGGP
jgi:hypothetical protein